MSVPADKQRVAARQRVIENIASWTASPCSCDQLLDNLVEHFRDDLLLILGGTPGPVRWPDEDDWRFPRADMRQWEQWPDAPDQCRARNTTHRCVGVRSHKGEHLYRQPVDD